MIIWLNPYTAEEFVKYVNDFDVDEEVELHRQSKQYKDAFTLRQSLDDFTNFHNHLEEIVEKLETLKLANGGGVDEDTKDMDEVFKQYVISALWSSTDDEGTPLDSNYTINDIDDETLAQMRKDVEQFFEQNKDAIDRSGLTYTQVAHDFWLTRNHHGAGFFDHAYDDDAVEEQLTKAAHAMKSTDLYVGDDGKIYAMGGYAEGGEITPSLISKITKEHDENTDINAHQENTLLLAQHFGDSDDVAQAEATIKLRDKQGSLKEDEFRKDYLLYSKLYKRYKSAKQKLGV
jgi:hypothetical protein